MRLCSLLCFIATALPAQTLYVATTGSDSNPGTQLAPFLTISKAIAVGSAGTTIRVAAGTYGSSEQIEFTTNSMTLVGAGIGQTVIVGHATLTKSYPTGYPPGIPDNHRVGIAVNGSARVDVRDLTVDMSFNHTGLGGTGRLYGMLFLNGADGTVEGVEVKNTRTSPFGGGASSADVIVRGDHPTDPCDVVIRRSSLHDYAKAGCVASFLANVTVEDCLVVGGGPTSSIAQVGIQVGFGAKATLLGNVVKDVYYSLPSYTSNGILLYDAAAGSLVEGNSLCRAQGAIFAYRSVPASVPVTIRRNTVTESDYGAAISFNGSATVTDNVFHGGALTNVQDDTPTNTWARNNYSDWSGVGPYVVVGGIVDPAPRRGADAFLASAPTVTAGMPIEVVIADFNNDTKLDFACVNGPVSAAAQPTVTIGIATAFPGYAVQHVAFGAAGEMPAGIVTGQLDGAAGLDLAVASASVSRVYVFPNTPASLGTFGTALGGGFTLASGQFPNDLAAGDLDGDGKDDLVVALLGGSPGTGGGRVLINNGTGTSFAQTALPGLASAQCKGVAIGLLDGDALRDIAITEGTSSTGKVDVFLNGGGGTFAAQATFSPIAVDADPTSVAISDVSADGKNDILLTCTATAFPGGPGSAIVLRNVLPAAAAFAADRHAVGSGPTSIVSGDFGNDADPDSIRRDALLVNVNNGTLSVLTSHGAFGFEGNLVALSGTAPVSIALGDLNKDGYLDYLVADAANQRVLPVLGRPLARNDSYGTGCAGTGGRKPYLQAIGTPAAPVVPNPGFVVALANGAASSPCALLLSGAGVPSPFECSLLLASLDIVLSTGTDAAGRVSVPIPIPNNPGLYGAAVYFQGAVADLSGGFLGFIALTQGLQVRVGI